MHLRGGVSLILALLLAALAQVVQAQELAYGRNLFEIDTAHFALYFPAELRREAGRLASFADEAYGELALLYPLGAEEVGRLPVLLADGRAELNGYFTAYPSNRIVIYASPAPLGPSLGSLDDELRSVFFHEVAHALSFSTRSPFWKLWAGILGDPIEPALWGASPLVAEGSAIFSESGRAGDPLAAAPLRQDLLENRFKDFWQASGAWDAYPYGELPYAYGARFVADLVSNHGAAAFSSFWADAGTGLFPNAAFRKAYGESLDRLWSEFRSRSAVRDPVVMESERLEPGPALITALAAGRGRLFWADASRGSLFALELDSGKRSTLLPADDSIERIDPSVDGRRLLLSFRRVEAGKETSVVRVWDLETRRFVGPELTGLREAAFARGSDPDALLALSAEGFRTDLVLVQGGSRRVLLRGGPERSYGSPLSPDGRRIYLLAREQGKVLLLRFDLPSGAAETLLPGQSLDHLRSLSLAARADPQAPPLLALSFASDAGLYRLALLEDGAGGGSDNPGSPLLRCQETLLSGSVFAPVAAADGRIYYLGRFSDGEYLCRYPEDNTALALRESAASWAGLDPSFLSPDETEPTEPDAAGLGGAAMSAAPAPAPAPALPLLTKNFRLPSLSPDLDAAGIDFVGSDIAQRLAYWAEAQYSWGARAVNLGSRLSFGLRPWTLGLDLDDRFSPAPGGDYRRRSAAQLELSRDWELGPSWRGLSIEGRAGAAALAELKGGDPYQAAYDSGALSAGLALRYDSYRGAYFPPFLAEGYGAETALDAEWAGLGSPAPRPAFALEGGFDSSTNLLGLGFVSRLALSPDASLDFGPRTIGRPGSAGQTSTLLPRYPGYVEYGSVVARGPWYGFGELSVLLAALELGARPLGGPLYLQRLALRAGFRGAALGAPPAAGSGLGASLAAAPLLLSSTYGRLSLEGAPLVGMAVETKLLAALELAYAFDAAQAGGALHLTVFLGLTY